MDDPCSWAASRAWAIWFAIGSASSRGMGPRVSRCARSSPSTSSITRAETPSTFFEPVDGGNVRMIQRREDFGLALKARQSVGISGKRGRQDLDGDLTFQLRVGRPIHLAHPAFADRRGDFVDPEAGTRSEGQIATIKRARLEIK